MRNNNPNAPKLTNRRNSLGMDQTVYTRLLRKLNYEHEHDGDPTNPNRIHTRLEYHEPYLDLEFETSDRSRRSITVAARNISRGGLSVLHSSFTYTGTRIRTLLSRIDGKPYQATGTVVRCDHRGGVVHEIGIRFDMPIIVQEFIRPDIMQCVRTHERVHAPDLKKSLLVVGQDDGVIPFVRQFLLPTNIKYAFAATPEEAEKRNPSEHDMILCCLQVGDLTGPEYTRQLRDRMYNRPIILVGSCVDESTSNQIRLSTADAFIPAPISEDDLHCAMGEYMLTIWDEKILAAVRKHHTAQTGDALRAELAKHAILLDQHIRTGDPVQVFATCNKVRSLAPLLGLGALREKALTVAESVAQSGEIQPHAADLHEIKAMCIDRSSAA